MDTPTLVEVERAIDQGWKLFQELQRHGFPVTVAFWARETLDEKWYFYIATPLVDEEGIREAYSKLLPFLPRDPLPFVVDANRVTLIASSKPAARGAVEIVSSFRTPLTEPLRWRGIMIGNLSVDDAYFYPLPAVTPV